MKKVFLFLSVMAICGISAMAQWATPGTGYTYTMENLAAVSQGCVQYLGDNTYLVADDLTISASDVLAVEDNVQQIIIDDEKSITINGGIICGDYDHETVFTAYEDHEYGYFNIRFEDCTSACRFIGVAFFYGCGFKVIGSDVAFDLCIFSGFNTKEANAVIDFFQCSPVITNCLFINNDGGAISSAVNNSGSPQIINNSMICNVTINENIPQINLGPGADSDSIRIVGNYIEGGGFSMSGGIAIADLIGTGDTKVLLKDNMICGNRYGYNQQGYNISSLIIGNQILDNNAEIDPMNGGSGISIYGMNTNNKAVLRDNVIAGNLWGITAIYYNDIDMGTAEDPGNNVIYGNHNDGYGEDAEFAIYVNSFSDITAIGNYWGQNSEDYVESVIYHRPDLGDSYGLVTYSPIQTINPDVLAFVVLQEDNEFLPHDYEGIIDHENHTVDIGIPVDYLQEPYMLCVRFEIPLGTVCGLESGEIIDLTEPVVMPINTPHGDYAEWIITLHALTGVEEQIESGVHIYSMPSEIVVDMPFAQANLCVYNTMGQRIYSEKTSDQQHNISTQGWTKGLYIVSVETQGHNVSRSVVVR